MQTKGSFKNFIEKIKQKKIILLFSLIYNFVWATCKILFGVFTLSYFFCISGAYTLLFGFIKKIYLKNYKTDDADEIKGKSITISILLIISGVLFTFYIARLFFVDSTKEYGLVLSIVIATFSFAELGISIYNFTKAKKTQDLLLQTFKGCSLVSSCFAIVLTQVALLSATGTPSNFYNAITGIIFGFITIIIGLYLLIKSTKTKTTDSISHNDSKEI